MRIPNIYSLITVILFIEFLGCKDKGVGPLPEKNPREYSWTSDTLHFPGSYQTDMQNIWASSPNDVYAVGFNTDGQPLWHYDGKTWTNVNLWGVYNIVTPQLNSIYGFASNNVWAVGLKGYDYADSSLIIHYDGSKWSETNIVRGNRGLNDIYGSSPNDIWACGWGGTVYHYDGIKWNKDSISIYNPQSAEFQLLSITESKNIVYIIGEKYENTKGSTYYFLKKSNQSWQIIDSLVSGPGTFKWGTSLWTSPEGNLFSFRDGVFKWNGNGWDILFSEPYALTSLAGTSEHSIFAVGNYGMAYHYNGSDWYQFPKLKNENIKYTGVWTDGNEAFICGFTTDSYPMKTIVWHGK